MNIRCASGNVKVALLFGLCVTLFLAKATAQKPPQKLLDLNRATVEELEKLPEIGPTTAKAIVRFREKSGAFRRVEDLLAVRGITKRRLEKIRPLVTVTPPAKPEQQGQSGKSPGTGKL